MRLDVGILLLQAVMSGLFVVLPVTIVATLHLPKEQLWKLYLPVLAVSIIPAFGAIAWAEAHRRVPQVFIAGIVLLAGSLCLLTEMYASTVGLVASVFLFFTAFNFLEGTVPSLVSRLAPPSRKGAALGIYTTAQFLGVGLGSWVVGYADTSYGLTGAFAACALMPIVWLVVHSIGSRIVVGGDHGTAVPAGRES
jgi:predicted MFS family arabinose efflux permease